MNYFNDIKISSKIIIRVREGVIKRQTILEIEIEYNW